MGPCKPGRFRNLFVGSLQLVPSFGINQFALQCPGHHLDIEDDDVLSIDGKLNFFDSGSATRCRENPMRVASLLRFGFSTNYSERISVRTRLGFQCSFNPVTDNQSTL